MDTAAVPCKVLIHRIVYDLIYQMVQVPFWITLPIYIPGRFRTASSLQDRDTARIISVFFCHSTDSFLFILERLFVLYSKYMYL